MGVDIGTSSCKVAVFDPTGTVIASATASYPTYHPAPGYAQQKPTEWWVGFCRAMKEIKVNPSDITAIGTAGQGWSAISVDKSGEVLFDNPIWMDSRAEDLCRKMLKSVPEEEIYALCGNPVMPTYTTPKILWLKQEHPAIYNKTYKILQSNSYIVYKLTGKFTSDYSQGYGLHFYDIRKREWNKEIAASFGISLDIMPELCPPAMVVGAVTKEAAAATGLREGTPVVAGGLDAACSTLGAGVYEPGHAQAQGGTAGGMSLCLDECITHPKLIMGNHVVEDRWLLQGGTVGGGGVLHWLKENVLSDAKSDANRNAKRDTTSSTSRDITYDEINALAAQSPAGAGGLIFLPYMAGERSPIWNSNAKGVYFGLDYSKGRGDIIRATMEGVAFSLLHNIDTAYEMGVYAKSYNLVGGIANSDVWMQVLADVTGRPFCAPSSDTGTNLGAAILAGIGTGVYSSGEDAVAQTVKIAKEYTPNMATHELYQQIYKSYRKLSECLLNIACKGGVESYEHSF